jgi:hypothetical protein
MVLGIHMTPGPELDSQVARIVFGYAVVIDTHSGEQYIVGKDHEPIPVPPYSTEIEAAYGITNQLHRMGFTLKVQNDVIDGKNIFFSAFVKQDTRKYLSSAAEDLPTAICKAGIAAVTGQNIQQ